jgi:AcrR family transcriptional regulator
MSKPTERTVTAPRSRKRRLTREQIARVALKIADAEGFEAVSMRRIAEALGAGTMTLYYYVRTR